MDNVQKASNYMKCLVEISVPNNNLREKCEGKVTKYKYRERINKACKAESSIYVLFL
jgi:hypothetical protein